MCHVQESISLALGLRSYCTRKLVHGIYSENVSVFDSCYSVLHGGTLKSFCINKYHKMNFACKDSHLNIEHRLTC